MDRGPEWRAFTKEERDQRGRVGIPISYSIHDKGLSTVIDRVNRDAYGRQLPLSTRLQMLKPFSLGRSFLPKWVLVIIPHGFTL